MGGCCSQGAHDDDPDDKIEYRGGNVLIISSRYDWDVKISEANKQGKIVVVNFSASWCGPCRVMAPIYADLSKKYPSLCFVSVDVDELSEFSSSWDIRATPTFYFLRDGEQLDHLVGANKPELEKKVAGFAESLAQAHPRQITV